MLFGALFQGRKEDGRYRYGLKIGNETDILQPDWLVTCPPSTTQETRLDSINQQTSKPLTDCTVNAPI